MSEKNNMVAHYEGGGSDKVYMACVRQAGAQWQVVGKWGRRGKTLSSSIKTTTSSETQARMEQASLFREKLSKGYEDIDSGSYRGPVSRSTQCIADNLEVETKAPSIPKRQPVAKPARKEEEKPGKPEDAEGMVALCVDAGGLDNRFDEGIEYVFESHADAKMLWVYDKLGEKRECFKERFRLVKES